jgi:alpha/beta superfamily hydrolase
MLFLPDRLQMKKAPALCICHGIPSGNPPDPNDPGYPQLARDLTELGLVVVIFNFRGTGLSGGNFDILGWTKDLGAILDFLWNRSEVDRSRIFVMGFSGGGVVSIYCAAHDPRISYVIACASPAEFHFAQDHDRAQVFLNHCRNIGIIREDDFPPSPDAWIDNFKKISPKKWIKKISPRPILLIHGDADDLVNVSHAKTLYAHSANPKELEIVRGAGHRLRLEKKVISKAANWVKKHIEIDS